MSTENLIPAEQLPRAGSTRRFDIHGQRILIANIDGGYHAVADTCSHEDASLSLGALKGETISCPLHGSRFCLRTGQALDEPAEEAIAVYATRLDGSGNLLLALV